MFDSLKIRVEKLKIELIVKRIWKNKGFQIGQQEVYGETYNYFESEF